MKFNIPSLIRKAAKKKELSREDKLNMLGDDIVNELMISYFEKERLGSEDLAYVVNRIVATAKDSLEARASLYYSEHIKADRAAESLTTNIIRHELDA